MSRREEVEATLSTWSGLEAGIQLSARRELCRTLADEVDARDAIIDKLIAMMEPGENPNCMDPKYNPSKMQSLTEYDLHCVWHGMRKQAHARACEIAGRVK